MLHLHAKLLILVVFTVSVSFNTLCFSQNVIEYLPGFPGKLPFKLETGYIGVGENEDLQLFYYFFESERNPREDPLMLWVSGGPGCSSLSAVFYEIGPFTMDYIHWNDTLPALMLKDYSWTKVSSIIFLDVPVGAGFSYGKTPESYYSSDTAAAESSYEFLRKWLIKHPKYIKNALYVGGVSYSGISVPIIVDNIYKGIEAGTKPIMNFKGYVLGNPHTDAFNDLNERVPYAYGMGLLSKTLYESAKVNCRGNYLHIDPDNTLCQNDVDRINECLDRINNDMILEPKCNSIYRKKDVLSLRISSSRFEEISTDVLQSVVATVKKPLCRNFPLVLVHTWANNKFVRKALHVREGTKGEWVRCNNTIRVGVFEPSEDAPYIVNVHNVIPYHKNFTRKNCRAMVYSGDHDLTFSHISTEKWVGSLKVPILSDWRPWFVDGQIAGYTMTYARGDYDLTYVTVKGAGHIAPKYKPVECFSMVSRWFDETPL